MVGGGHPGLCCLHLLVVFLHSLLSPGGRQSAGPAPFCSSSPSKILNMAVAGAGGRSLPRSDASACSELSVHVQRNQMFPCQLCTVVKATERSNLETTNPKIHVVCFIMWAGLKGNESCPYPPIRKRNKTGIDGGGSS